MPCCCWVKHYFWSTRGSCLWHRTTITTSKLVGQIYRIGQAHLGMAPIQSMSVWKSFGIQEGGKEGGIPNPEILPRDPTFTWDLVQRCTKTNQYISTPIWLCYWVQTKVNTINTNTSLNFGSNLKIRLLAGVKLSFFTFWRPNLASWQCASPALWTRYSTIICIVADVDLCFWSEWCRDNHNNDDEDNDFDDDDNDDDDESQVCLSDSSVSRESPIILRWEEPNGWNNANNGHHLGYHHYYHDQHLCWQWDGEK